MDNPLADLLAHCRRHASKYAAQAEGWRKQSESKDQKARDRLIYLAEKAVVSAAHWQSWADALAELMGRVSLP